MISELLPKEINAICGGVESYSNTAEVIPNNHSHDMTFEELAWRATEVFGIATYVSCLLYKIHSLKIKEKKV